MKVYPHFYPFSKTETFSKLLNWANQNFEFFALFEGNAHTYPGGPFDSLFFAGNIQIEDQAVFDELNRIEKIGIISYEYKNRTEHLKSENPEFFELPELCFFKPEYSFAFAENGLYSKHSLPDHIFRQILDSPVLENGQVTCTLNPMITREEYLERVKSIQNEILEGNTYEANFCQAFSGEFEFWDPITAYLRLNQLSAMPFAGLFKAKNNWLVSASPERFLKKTDCKLLSQPIKGTMARGADEREDRAHRAWLFGNEKERAENLMITDLTRNDLAKISQVGSVKVEELFGIYPFQRVFQMITSVSATLNPGVGLKEIIQSTFPMGSMTGAPKISTMNILEREEGFRRAWFSGAFGWIDEEGNFDFSVIIRSIIADLDAKKLYFGVGSAITSDASAEEEYEECKLKAQALIELLRGH